MAAGPDFYQVLGISKDASQDDIQRAYRKLARQHHPDVNSEPAAEERFKDVSEAYAVLSDPATRRRYDAFGPDFRQVPPDLDPDTWQRERSRARAGAGAGASGYPGGPGGSGGPAGPGGPGGSGGSGGSGGFGFGQGDVDIEDLLGGLFGGRGGRSGPSGRTTGRGWGPIRGADQEAELSLTVEEAYHGGRRSITLTGPGGERKFDVSIPAGVTDGQRIRLAGQGGQGSDGAPPGDLYLIAALRPHPRYRVSGRDLTTDLRLAPWEAALGTSVAIDTPDGEAKVQVPPGTSSGKRLRLRGRGLRSSKGKPGDFYAETKIVVPASLSDAERQLFEQLAATSAFDPRSRR